MKRERQLPFTFNNDRQVKAFRDSLKSFSSADLKLIQTSADQEYSHRHKTSFPDRTKESISGFLDKISFDYFCTFTTRRPVSLHATRRIADTVCNRIQAGKTSSVFWAAEEFDVREGFHFHALMKLERLQYQEYREDLFGKRELGKIVYQEYSKMDLFNWYSSKYGRCQIIDNREPARQQAASHYVSKYITKKITDYDFRISPYHMR